uniref:Uncharacterized protein n=1 Tax=Anguilla anguilla TaxID=7936 RepID=A0A0E9URW7_ANGAN
MKRTDTGGLRLLRLYWQKKCIH